MLDSPKTSIIKLLGVSTSIIASLIFLFIWVELVLNWPLWISDLLLALIAGLSSGLVAGLIVWLFDKFALENRHQSVAHEGVKLVIGQSLVFVCNLSIWKNKQKKSEIQKELQKHLKTEEPDITIGFGIQQIESLRDIKITNKSIKGLIKYVREHLDFLERIINLYDSSFMYCECCKYLFAQHSELCNILLIFENIPTSSKAVSKNMKDRKSTSTKIVLIDKAFKLYLDYLEKFLKQAQIELKKDRI